MMQVWKMEKRLYDAAVEGNKISLLNLLQEDALLLDRFITGSYPETPLHVASILGHLEFVDEILTHMPELAKELDSRKSSPLHLAAAKGNLQVAKSLLHVNPDMCLVCDVDGRNPIHIAAIKGHHGLLRKLVDARTWAARVLMEQGETILHACVRCNQLDSLRLLVERVSDHEFVNRQNYDGNNILHLAIATKQTEAINFLISSTTINVNCVNEDGFAALDLLSQNQRNVEEKEIVESLQRMRAIHAKNKPLSDSQLKVIRTKILLFTSDQSNAIPKSKKRKNRKRSVNKDAVWVEKKHNTLMLVASLLATMAFQAGVNPPTGIGKDNALSDSSRFSLLGLDTYNTFLKSNTIGFLTSISIILLLISGIPLHPRFFTWVLTVFMWIAISAMSLAYLSSVFAFVAQHEYSPKGIGVGISVLLWIVLMLLLLLGHTIRLVTKLIHCHLHVPRKSSTNQ